MLNSRLRFSFADGRFTNYFSVFVIYVGVFAFLCCQRENYPIVWLLLKQVHSRDAESELEEDELLVEITIL